MISEPILLVADKKKKIFDLPGYQACGQSGERVSVLSKDHLIPLPEGSNLFFLPDRDPVGFNAASGTYETLDDLYPVAAFIPPGYTQTFTVAYQERARVGILPLFSYTPVAWYKGRIYVPAVRIDRRKNHNICSLDKGLLARKISVFKNSSNRLIHHLAGCAQANFCPNAINFFLGKYECPLPTSPACNARCLGCISYQPQGSCSATQPRLTFVPTADEIAEIALLHIKNTPRAVVSVGQGCEGEPLLAASVIRRAIIMIRKETSRGTIHMNTNGSLTSEVEALCEAGIDSFRVSLNSAQEELYHRYYIPRGYSFMDVQRSIAMAKRHKKFVSLNYLTMPGFTDREDEFKALVRLISKTRIDMIQWRNLNYDPLLYFKRMKPSSGEKLLGVEPIMTRLQKQFPKLRHGYFNLPKESW
jgi:pyruvate-formate lyase-activating enzyme